MKLYSVALLGVMLLLSLETNEPTLLIEYEQQITPGDTVIFSIYIENTTPDQCNEGIVYVDIGAMDQETVAHITNVSPPVSLPGVLRSRESFDADLEMEIGYDTPNGDYTIIITFEGTLGSCDGGCFPFSISQELPVKVVRHVPNLHFECTRSCDVIGGANAEMSMTITNVGSGEAKDIKISISGDLEGYASPDTLEMIEPLSSSIISIYFDTTSLPPGFYDMGLNVIYYDDYLKLYSDKVNFRVQVRPQRPLININVLYDKRSIIIDLENEGGLKAKDIDISAFIDGDEIAHELIDEIKSRGILLIPIKISDNVEGEINFIVDTYYYDTEGKSYFGSKEIFLNIPKNTTESNNVIYYLIGFALVLGILAVLVRKQWKEKR